MDYLLGHSFGHYHIIERLGEGGMATTFKAYDTHQEKYVALIVVRVSKELSEERIQLLNEAGKRLKQLSHPNLVAVLDFGMQKNMPYLVTHFENVRSLKHYPGLPIAYQKAASLLAPMARALEYLHNEGMIHGDIKPSNILIANDQKPLLADVGATRMIEIGCKEDISSGGMGFGTPAYMSPEQVSGDPINQRSDIYALGIVFFELITARKPYDADTPLAVLTKQVHEPLIRPSKLNPAIPERVEQIIFKATAKNPEDRYQTMSAFAQKLEEIAADEDKTEQLIVVPKPVPQAAAQPSPQATPQSEAKTVQQAVPKSIPQPKAEKEKPAAEPVEPGAPPAMPVYEPVTTPPHKKFSWAWIVIVLLFLILCAVICVAGVIAFGLVSIPGFSPLFPLIR